MKREYRLLLVALLSSGLGVAACASGETVGTTTGNGSGNGGRGGSSGSGQGGRGGSSSTTGAGGGNFTSGAGGSNTTTGSGGTFGSGQGGSSATTGSGGTFGTGQGGSTGTTGAGGAGAFMQTCVPTAPLIADMEDGMNYYGMTCPKGGWYLATKGGGTVMADPAFIAPSGAIAPVAVSPANPGNAASTKAIHVSGGGQTNTTATSYDAYVSMSASLNRPSTTEKGWVSTAAYTGVQFWGKITGTVRLQVAVPTSDGEYGMCGTMCDDNPGAMLTPSASWMLYKIPFSSLTQEGFGMPTTYSGSATKIAWKVIIPATGPTPAWDIWVDDLSFY